MKKVWFIITDGDKAYSTCGREELSERIKYMYENYSNHADIVILKHEKDDNDVTVLDLDEAYHHNMACNLDEAYHLLVKMDMIEKGRCTWSV